jgi:hypothetical protein
MHALLLAAALPRPPKMPDEAFGALAWVWAVD